MQKKNINNNLRLHIGVFGRRNTGKSSVINLLTGQESAIVSDTPGTTTDPVRKPVEIPGLGPVVLIDTAGVDDAGELGEKRVEKTLQIVKQVDIALLVFSGNHFAGDEALLAKLFQQYHVPFLLLHNKSDQTPADESIASELTERYPVDFLDFSAKTAENLETLVLLLQKNRPDTLWQQQPLFGDLVKKGEMVLLITPIDSEAPEGRLILPQVQAIREGLDNDCIVVVLKENEVETFIRTSNIEPALVITDSQLFGNIDNIIPPEIPLTGFSVLLARQKGNFEAYLDGTPHIDRLKDGDRVLIMESCTHHSTCDDIGRVKIPRWLRDYTGRQLEFDIVAGLAEPLRPIRDYALVIQCGGCMITRKQLLNRIQSAVDARVPVTNYGMAIAYIKGTWERAVSKGLKGER